MNLDKLFSIAVKLALLATLSGQLPFFLRNLKIAQLKLIQESQASRWPKWNVVKRMNVNGTMHIKNDLENERS